MSAVRRVVLGLLLGLAASQAAFADTYKIDWISGAAHRLMIDAISSDAKVAVVSDFDTSGIVTRYFYNFESHAQVVVPSAMMVLAVNRNGQMVEARKEKGGIGYYVTTIKNGQPYRRKIGWGKGLEFFEASAAINQHGEAAVLAQPASRHVRNGLFLLGRHGRHFVKLDKKSRRSRVVLTEAGQVFAQRFTANTIGMVERYSVRTGKRSKVSSPKGKILYAASDRLLVFGPTNSGASSLLELGSKIKNTSVGIPNVEMTPAAVSPRGNSVFYADPASTPGGFAQGHSELFIRTADGRSRFLDCGGIFTPGPSQYVTIEGISDSGTVVVQIEDTSNTAAFIVLVSPAIAGKEDILCTSQNSF